jgi:hypothetical protein
MPEQPVTIFTPAKTPVVNQAPAVPVRTSAPVQSATSPVVTSSPLQSEPEKRWAAEREAIKAADPWQQDPSKVVMRKDADGIVRAVPRTDGGVNGVPPEPGAQPQPGPAAVGADGRLVVGDMTLSPEDVRGLLERKGIEDSRRASMPASAADYATELPSDFQVPAGLEWAWDETPVGQATMGQVKTWAFENGFDQSQFSRMLSFFASHQLREQQQFNQARSAEITKLGSNAAGRVDAVNTWLTSMVGSELAGSLRKSMLLASQVNAYERLMRAFVTQGVSGNVGAGRDGAGSRGPERVSDAEYQKMSYTERQAYASRFDQRQFGGS